MPMTHRGFAVLGLTATLAAWTPAPAMASGPGSPDAPLPPVLQRMVGAGGHVTYLGTVDGLPGYLVTRTRPDGSVLAIPAYVSPGGGHAFLGHAHDADGADVTELQETRLQLRLEESKASVTPSPPLDVGRAPDARPLPPDADAVAAEAAFGAQVRATTASFHVGRAGAPVAYLIADVGSTDGERLGDMMRPMAAAGSVDLVVVATGTTPAAEEAAVGLLSQPQVARAWYSRAAPTRVPPTAADAASLRGWVESNNAFARSLGVSDGPVMAYADATGKWVIRHGVPATAPVLAAPTDGRSTR